MIQADDYQLLEELRHRNQWIDDARKLIAFRKAKPEAIMHTLERFKADAIGSEEHEVPVHFPMIDEQSHETRAAMREYKAKLLELEKLIESRVQSDAAAARERRETQERTRNRAALDEATVQLERAWNELHEAAAQLRDGRPQRTSANADYTGEDIDELIDSRTRYVFDRFAKETNFLDFDGNGYRWNAKKPMTHFAVFVATACDKKRLALCLPDGRMNWKLFKAILGFDDAKIDTARNGLQKMNQRGLYPPDIDTGKPGGTIIPLFDRFLKEYEEEND